MHWQKGKVESGPIAILKMKQSEKELLYKFLSNHKLMSLGTYYRAPWAASVYFLIDKDLNLYFLSSPDTRHCKNIAKNPKVSVTVADSRQKASERKEGFQMMGVAKPVGLATSIKQIVALWNKSHTDTPPIDFHTLTKVWKSKFYKITPQEIKLFSQKLYGDDEEKEWILKNI